MGIEQELAKLSPPQETLLAVGVFDGVHMGHRHLLEILNRRAREENLLSGVVTFDSHPQLVLQSHSQLPSLGKLEERVKKLRGLGITLIAVLSFTPELASLSAREFVGLLKKHLKMHGLIIGPDFALGKGREGGSEVLSLLGREMGFDVEVVLPFILDDEIVSSTRIRQSLTQGDMAKVAKLMGHNFYLSGQVIPATKCGRKLGFPTANLAINPEQALPSNGVYATIASIGKNELSSVTSIGVRPTFGQNEKTVETYLFNYEGDLYAQELKVEFIRKLRDEQRFDSPEELKAQIQKDVEAALKLFTDHDIVLSRAGN